MTEILDPCTESAYEICHEDALAARAKRVASSYDPEDEMATHALRDLVHRHIELAGEHRITPRVWEIIESFLDAVDWSAVHTTLMDE